MQDWLDDLRTAFALLTRLPWRAAPDPQPAPNRARAGRAFPLVGLAVGGAVGLVYAALTALDVPALAAAALALGLGCWLTGAMHEQGLAICVAGFGGGDDRSAKLELMRDRRIDAVGAMGLLVVMMAKIGAVAALSGAAALFALVVAHALARATIPAVAATLARARRDGLAASAGRPDGYVVWLAGFLALALAMLLLPLEAALLATIAAAAAALVVGMIADRQIGGHTGHVLDAAEQAAETAALCALAAVLV